MRHRTVTWSWCVSFVASAGLVLAACGQQAPAQLSSDEERVVVSSDAATALPDLVAAADVLALQLIAGAGEVTTVTSPASLQLALSMASEGAEGQTLAELESLVGASGAQRSDGMNALIRTLADLEGDPAIVREDELPDTPVVHRASRLVLDESLSVEQAFVDALARSYDALPQTTDLGSKVGTAVLDAWVDEHTGGLIPRSAITPGPDLKLVLQDAIVLAARWDQPFLPELTQPHPFTLPSGEQVEVDMMNTGAARDTLYAEVEGWQAVRLPYSGGRLSAEVILPPPGAAASGLSPTVMGDLRRDLDTEEPTVLQLRMPVVDAQSTLDLMPYLRQQAPSSVEGGFGGISEQPLALRQAVQQGVLAIDEDGTLAAAVTELGAAGSEPVEPPLELVVDRPYLVRISDEQTGWPLFVALVTDPRGQ
jgi:serpin B